MLNLVSLVGEYSNILKNLMEIKKKLSMCVDEDASGFPPVGACVRPFFKIFTMCIFHHTQDFYIFGAKTMFTKG